MNKNLWTRFGLVASVLLHFTFLCHSALGVAGAANEAPVVALTSPRDGSVFSTLSAISLAASATDDGAIDKVEFFDNGSLIGTDSTQPYAVVVSLPAGSHELTAKATDNMGVATTSSVVTVTVKLPNQAPVVALTAPANGATFVASESITFSANASDDGAITKVEFFSDGVLIGTDNSAPYSISAMLAAGVHSITVRAWDDTGSATTLPPISITVNGVVGPPQVELSSAQAGKVIAAPGTVVLAAVATDDGSIVGVDFLRGAELLSVDSEAPYEASVSGLAAGLYTFSARARDDSGNSAVSASVEVRVVAAPDIISISLNGSSVSIVASATEGVSFELQRSADFIEWDPVERKVSSGSTVTFAETADEPASFYRVVAVSF